MKHFKLTFLLTVLMSMVGAKALAHDIEVKNADGVTIYYRYNSDNTSVYVSYRGNDYDSYSNEYTGVVNIPSSITYNGKGYSVTSIRYDAFRDCSSLTSVTIPNSVTSIGSSAFYDCSGLTSVTIPNSVTSIGEYAFFDTAWYNNQPNGLVYAGKVAYKYKGTMPANTSISLNEGTLSITSSAFSGYSGLTSISIPNSVTSIGSSAFYGCSGLTSVTIGNGVTSIGGYAFYNCVSLQKVIIEDIAAWLKISFSGADANPLYYAHHLYSDENTEITNLVIPDGVTRIGGSAFLDCSDLTSVTIPNSVTSIGGSAFEGCI